MKKIIIFMLVLIIIFGMFFPTIIRPNLSRSFHNTFVNSTNLNKEKFEGFKLYDNIYSDEFVSIYGKQTNQSRDNIFYSYFQLTKGIEIAVNNKGEILRFIITDKDLETGKGIKIGDKDTDVKNVYGNNYYFRIEQGTDILGYTDKSRNISIEFWMHDNKVAFIRLDDISMD